MRCGRSIMPALGLAAVLSGCASGPGPARLPLTTPAWSEDEAGIRHQAALEAAGVGLTRQDVPVPPGVAPGALESRRPADPRAHLALAAALADVEARPVSSDGPGQEPVEPAPVEALSDEALRHYVKGYDASLAGNFLLAIPELERAHELAPGSVRTLRRLARAYAAQGIATRAAARYRRLLALRPEDPEALLMLGAAAADRRRFDEAARLLGRLRTAGTAAAHDPGAPFVLDEALARALQALGYDRAVIELAGTLLELPEELDEPTAYADRLAAIRLRRGEMRRQMGDALCRLGSYEEALAQYAAAGAQTFDPGALPPRILYANLRLGRCAQAQCVVLEILKEALGHIGDEEVRLGAYVAAHVKDRPRFARAVLALHEQRRDEAGLTRAASVLLPAEQGLALLRESIDRQPRDLEVVADVLGWFSGRDVVSAVRLIVDLVGNEPDLADDYVRTLARFLPRPEEAIDVLEALPASPARANVHARLLRWVGALGEAWSVARDARRMWPEDLEALFLQLDLAAQMEEPGLLERALAEAAPIESVRAALARARALRAVGDNVRSIDAAEQALELAPDDPAALEELARCHLSAARGLGSSLDRGEHASIAGDVAAHVVQLAPERDEPYAVLVDLYGPGGPAADRQMLRRVVRRLGSSNPDSRLLARLQAEEALARQQFDEGIARLISLSQRVPPDRSVLPLLMTAWMQLDQLDEAEAWLRQELQDRPGDPDLLQWWVQTQFARSRSDEAIGQLESRLAEHPSDHVVRHLLESSYRQAGRLEDALPLGEQRLRARPETIRRALELAALSGGAGREQESLAQLRWIAAHHEEGTLEELATAISVARRIEGAGDAAEQLALSLVTQTIERFPEAPLQVYGSGLLAMARLEMMDERFDELADRAVAMAEGAMDRSLQSLAQWRDLAQALADAGEPAAAARAVRARVRGRPLLWEQTARALAPVVFVADAAADQPDASIEFIGQLGALGELPQMFQPGRTPTPAEALYEVSVIYSLVGTDAATERLLRESLRLEPDQPIVLNNLGYMRIEAGHDDEASIGWVERAFELEPENSFILDTVGWLRYRQGRFADEGDERGALSLIQQAIRASGDPSAEVLDHLGDTLWRLDDRQGAIDAWRRALQMLEAPEHRRSFTQGYLQIQTRRWGLLVADPDDLYDRVFGAALERLQRKVASAEQDGDPPVARTFQELAGSEHAAGGAEP